MNAGRVSVSEQKRATRYLTIHLSYLSIDNISIQNSSRRDPNVNIFSFEIAASEKNRAPKFRNACTTVRSCSILGRISLCFSMNNEGRVRSLVHRRREKETKRRLVKVELVRTRLSSFHGSLSEAALANARANRASFVKIQRDMACKCTKKKR